MSCVQFISAANDVCEMLHDAGFWADFIDPASGRPVSIYVELRVEFSIVLLFFVKCIAIALPFTQKDTDNVLHPFYCGQNSIKNNIAKSVNSNYWDFFFHTVYKRSH